jgi:tRNA nucleotidyltransferase (CCA-adding enzyme)
MKLNYLPQTKLEKFGQKIFNLLVENFPQTFYVGGMVRDYILHRQLTDIDIATEGTPLEVSRLLKKNRILINDAHNRFGIIVASHNGLEVEVATFRKDLQSNSRYPNVKFITSAKTDSQRRDFTINSLYLRQNKHKLIDYQRGINDIKSKNIRFIGNPNQRIKQDPLRIARALRFALALNFSLDPETKSAILDNYNLLETLSKNKLKREIDKLKQKKARKILSASLSDEKTLDKHF